MDRLLHSGTTDSLLFSCLDVVDLIQFAKVNRRARDCVSGYRRAAHSIFKTLSPYFCNEEIEQFRVLQSCTGTLISGSSALSFFNRTVYPGSDLDIYVEHRYSSDIALFLEALGYVFAPRPKQSRDLVEAIDYIGGRYTENPHKSYLGRGIADVYDFSRRGAKIQLITSVSCPLDIILRFHSTVVMNIITSQYAISFYPWATFVQQNSLVCSTDGAAQTKARNKYRDRGWAMIDEPTAYQMTTAGHDFHSRPRFVGDSRCWTIQLPKTAGELGPETIFTNSWRLSYASYDYGAEASIDYEVSSKHPRLQYRYVLAPKFDFSALEKKWANKVIMRDNKYK
ncbi:hypothetical protein C8J56DRAFT_1061447 [Mycena floridula]|nr:hypothetical protein C8J56DRAFT_1063144 [Mycena floridula]KAJ7577311.1 hypothetical protein C8J56DRAFT_1061447 [Mycena floridula]